MTLSQTIIWTALPNGHPPGHPGTLRLSIFVSPRLMTDAVPAPTLPLSDFPDFLDWPATKIKWKVTIGGHTPTPVTVTSPAPRSDLWKALFDGTTEVTPYQSQSLSGNTFHSYPAWWVRDFHVKTYAMLAATSPTEWPSLNTLGLGPNGIGPYHALPFNFDEEQRAIDLIGSALKAGVQGPLGGP